MNLDREIDLRPGHGRYWPAMLFHWTAVLIVLLPTWLMFVALLLNPIRRQHTLDWFESRVHGFNQWRNRIKYHIYLGCDPRIWHQLKK